MVCTHSSNLPCLLIGELPPGDEEQPLLGGSNNVRTYNFEFRNYETNLGLLPGRRIVITHCQDECQAVHNNVRTVAEFITNKLQYEFIRDSSQQNSLGVQYISSINCVETSLRNECKNAAWHLEKQQVIFGQRFIKGQLRSYGSDLAIVAHEFCHGLISQIVKRKTETQVPTQERGFIYPGESAALEESLCDIFAILVCNFSNPDIEHWNWNIGEGFGDDSNSIRDLSDPQFDNIYNALNMSGEIHNHSITHSRAFYHLLNSGDSLFNAKFVIQLFYSTLERLNRDANFIKSREAMLRSARILLRRKQDPNVDIEQKLGVISNAFDNVGIC